MNRNEKTDESRRITENLLRCGELTELCLELRLAVLRQEFSDEEARKRLWREIREPKHRAW